MYAGFTPAVLCLSFFIPTGTDETNLTESRYYSVREQNLSVFPGIYSVAAIQRGIRTLRGSERVTQAESRRASRVRGFAIFVVEVLVTLRYNVFIKTNEVTPKVRQFHWPPFWIYTMLKIDQIIKCVWCFFRLKGKNG